MSEFSENGKSRGIILYRQLVKNSGVIEYAKKYAKVTESVGALGVENGFAKV